jgi:AraC family transcriptional regulator
VPPSNRVFVHPRYSIFYRQAKKLHWPEEVRPDYSVLFLQSGKLKYEVTGNSGSLEAKQVLLLEPSTTFSASGQNSEALFLTITPSFLMEYAVRMRLIGPAGNIGFQTLAVNSDARLPALATNLITELMAESAGREIVLSAVVEQIVVHLLRHFSNARRTDELELSRVGLIDRRVRRAVELMHAQLDRDLSLKEIAAASFLSPFHFARLFKKLTGATPHAYLAAIRTRQAQHLLAETDLSVTEISSRVGYSSASHFTKAFREATGLTPRAFRNALVSR